MSAERVIRVAEAELGYTETPPNSNRTKYGLAYGLDGYPWCAIFLWWCFREGGESRAFYGGGKTASCGALGHRKLSARRYRHSEFFGHTGYGALRHHRGDAPVCFRVS